MLEKFKVTFLPDKTKVEVDAGKSILKAAGEAGVELDGPCGGKGTCGKCRVHIVDEKNGNKGVLACRTQVDRDMTVEIPHLEVSLHRKNELSLTSLSVKPDPGVTKKVIMVNAPSLDKQDPDTARLLNALGRQNAKLKIKALQTLPKVLREKQGLVTAILWEDQVLAVEPGDTSDKLFGVAVDIGTTTLVAALVNLLDGETMAVASASNPQSTFGADVIARIEYAMQNLEGLGQLHHRVIQAINRLIGKLAKDMDISPWEIYQMTVVGNTTMSHLFLKTDPAYLASSPFIPAVSSSVQIEARDLGIAISPHAPVYVAPNIAGYVGSDTIGVIMATEIYQKQGTYLAIDIGTNGEIVLAHDGQLITCSTAAGPAFEGAQIKYGMRAANGAIERVVIGNDVAIKVIGNTPAKGICGSGLVDAVAELVRVGIIQSSGRLISRAEAGHLSPAWQQRLGSNESDVFFVLALPGDAAADAVLLTQKDIRELQLAKAAIRAGIQILLEQGGLDYQDIDEVLLAGAFGSYINKDSALGIGLLPPVSADKIKSVGNAAGTGARKALVSREIRRETETIARQVKHMELSCRPDFQEQFMSSLRFCNYSAR